MPWKEWAFSRMLKIYGMLGLLIFDCLVLVSFEEAGSLTIQLLSIVVALPLFYANYLVYAYLWGRPPKGLRHPAKFRPSLLHPVLIGRWESDRAEWLERASSDDQDMVAPEEFV